MKKLWILVLAALLQACGGGGGGGAPVATTPSGGSQPPQSCSLADQRQQVLSFMQDEYYWYPQLRAPDAGAPDMDAYFRSMLATPMDRFSFTESTAAYEQLFDTGTFTGYGYSLVLVDPATNLLRVRSVEPQGPAYAAGLRRGDTVVAIDNHTPAQIVAGEVPAVNQDGVPREIQVIDALGERQEYDMASATFPLTPVRDIRVVDGTRNGQPVKVGYMGYTQFVTYSVTDLTRAVTSLAQQGASELVLDLRYNGGGDVATSRDLASLIAGARVAGQVFASLRFNDKHPEKNENYTFAAPPASIAGLSRVFIITSGNTASASELVINGLKPFMDVVLVGETTFGKPYGFEPFDYCGITYNAVNFESVNALGVGGYTSGFAPNCPAPDDLDHQLGDPNEARLKTALGYIATGTCPQAGQSASISPASRNVRVFGDVRPPGMFRK
jgi:C-terminal processing protease CtpA/Prc